MEDLVSGLLCNPKGSRQQHLLFEGEIRATACWETNVACYDEVSSWGEGDHILVIKDNRVLGVSRVAAT